MFHPVERKSLSRSVFEQLSEQILRGTLSPGDNLPGERSLSDVLGVNRGAVREALKRLEQARLIVIQQGGATTVLNYLKTAGLDLLGQIVLTADGRLDTLAVRSLMELRTALAPDIARRCALRHDADIARSLTVALRKLGEAKRDDQRQALSFELWQALIDGTGNVSYQLSFNSLKSAWGAVGALMTELMGEELADFAAHEDLVDATLARDAEKAARVARELVLRSEHAVQAVIDRKSDRDERYIDLNEFTLEA